MKPPLKMQIKRKNPYLNKNIFSDRDRMLAVGEII